MVEVPRKRTNNKKTVLTKVSTFIQLKIFSHVTFIINNRFSLEWATGHRRISWDGSIEVSVFVGRTSEYFDIRVHWRVKVSTFVQLKIFSHVTFIINNRQSLEWATGHSRIGWDWSIEVSAFFGHGYDNTRERTLDGGDKCRYIGCGGEKSEGGIYVIHY